MNTHSYRTATAENDDDPYDGVPLGVESSYLQLFTPVITSSDYLQFVTPPGTDDFIFQNTGGFKELFIDGKCVNLAPGQEYIQVSKALLPGGHYDYD